jgi:Flp pilus assembly protein TadD
MRTLLLPLALCLGVYWNALPGDFVFDDGITLESRFLTEGRLGEIFSGPDGRPAYRPVRTLAHYLVHRIAGPDPFAFHLLNVLCHAAACGFLYAIALRLGLSERAAMLGMALFAVHPVHTDAVTYISGARDVLCALFYLAGFLAYLRYRESGRILDLALLALAYLLSVGSKEMGVTLPLVCLAYRLTAGRARPGSDGPAFHAAFVVAAVLVMVPISRGDTTATMARAYHGGSLTATVLTMSRVFWHYAGPQSLLADHSPQVWDTSRTLADPVTALAFLGVLVAGLAPFALASRAPLAAFALFWHWLTLAPVSQLVPHTEMVAEHYLYQPSAAFCLGLGALLTRATLRAPRAGALCAGLVIALFSARTLARNLDWQDEYTLWSRTVADAPRCARARTNLALALEHLGRLDEAETSYRTALALMPDDPIASNNLGALLLARGHPADARAHLELALKIKPGYPEAANNLGAVLWELGEVKAAEAAFRRALLQRPGYASAMLNLADLLIRPGETRISEAEALCRAALARSPSPPAVSQLGLVLAARGQEKEALALLDAAVAAEPARPRWQLNRAAGLARLGRTREAGQALVAAAALDPKSPALAAAVAKQARALGISLPPGR